MEKTWMQYTHKIEIASRFAVFDFQRNISFSEKHIPTPDNMAQVNYLDNHPDIEVMDVINPEFGDDEAPHRVAPIIPNELPNVDVTEDEDVAHMLRGSGNQGLATRQLQKAEDARVAQIYDDVLSGMTHAEVLRRNSMVVLFAKQRSGNNDLSRASSTRLNPMQPHRITVVRGIPTSRPVELLAHMHRRDTEKEHLEKVSQNRTLKRLAKEISDIGDVGLRPFVAVNTLDGISDEDLINGVRTRMRQDPNFRPKKFLKRVFGACHGDPEPDADEEVRLSLSGGDTESSDSGSDGSAV